MLGDISWCSNTETFNCSSSFIASSKERSRFSPHCSHLKRWPFVYEEQNLPEDRGKIALLGEVHDHTQIINTDESC
jgi:hypothetical protein